MYSGRLHCQHAFISTQPLNNFDADTIVNRSTLGNRHDGRLVTTRSDHHTTSNLALRRELRNNLRQDVVLGDLIQPQEELERASRRVWRGLRIYDLLACQVGVALDDAVGVERLRSCVVNFSRRIVEMAGLEVDDLDLELNRRACLDLGAVGRFGDQRRDHVVHARDLSKRSVGARPAGELLAVGRRKFGAQADLAVVGGNHCAKEESQRASRGDCAKKTSHRVLGAGFVRAQRGRNQPGDVCGGAAAMAAPVYQSRQRDVEACGMGAVRDWGPESRTPLR